MSHLLSIHVRYQIHKETQHISLFWLTLDWFIGVCVTWSIFFARCLFLSALLKLFAGTAFTVNWLGPLALLILFLWHSGFVLDFLFFAGTMQFSPKMCGALLVLPRLSTKEIYLVIIKSMRACNLNFYFSFFRFCKWKKKRINTATVWTTIVV